MTRSHRPFLYALQPAAFASLATLAAMTLSQPLARAEEPGAVAILHMQLPSDWQAQQKVLEKKVKIALREGGFEVQSRAETLKRLASRSDLLACGASACMPEAAKLAKVDQLLRAALVTTKDVYTVNLEMFDSVDGKSLATHETSCHKNDLCPPVAEGWSAALRALGEKAKAALAPKTDEAPVVASPAAATTKEPAVAMPPTTAPAGSAQESLSTTDHVDVPEQGNHTRAWVLLGSGVVVAGAGFWLLSKDGDIVESDCADASNENTCPYAWNMAPAWGLVAAGSLSAVAGALDLFGVFGSNNKRSTALLVGPTSLALKGKF